MEKALLVTIRLKSERSGWSVADMSAELEELARSSGAEVVDSISCVCEKITPSLYIGKGKAQEIAFIAQEEGADVVVFGRDLSGTQQRNLEEVILKKTIDRTQLILDIFARHARTPEGKIQVELAQLQYLMPRLIGQGIILSRLGGGIGTSGPGEQKLEVDRRRIRKRIDRLKADLREITLHRQTLRKKRTENAVPGVALVGYTNAGKSTLLNLLTGAGQIVHDSLFTTLDPLSKSLKLPNGESVIISDTVGFLYNLPHHLIEAFKATLEEVVESDLLVHVIDIAHPLYQERSSAVQVVLAELGVQGKPLITALNKIDLLSDPQLLARISEEFPRPVAISAQSGLNREELLRAIAENFQARMVSLHLLIPHQRMDLIDTLYREGKVMEVNYLQNGIEVRVSLPKANSYKVLNEKGIVTID